MLTQEQITQLRGQAGLSATPPTPGTSDVLAQRKAALGIGQPAPEPAQPQFSKNPVGDYTQNVGQDIAGRILNVAKALNQPSNEKSFLGTVKEGLTSKLPYIAGQVGMGLVSPFTEAANSLSKTPIAQTGNDLVSGISNKIVNSLPQNIADYETKYQGQTAQNTADIVNKYQSWAQQHPEASAAFNGLFNIGQTALAGAGAEQAATGLAEVPEAAKDVAGKLKSNLAQTATAEVPKATSYNYLQDVKEGYDPKQLSQKIKNPDGTTSYRVSESSGLKSREPLTTQLEKDSAKALEKVQNYPTNGTKLQKYQAVDTEVANQDEAIKSQLRNEHILRPPKEVVKVVRDAVQKASQDSLLFQNSDPVVKTYMRVAQRAINASDGTLEGEMEARQAIDRSYKNTRGALRAYPGAGEKIAALDEIHKASRDALKDDLIAHARKTSVESAFKSQWDLIRARDTLLQAAQDEAPTAFGRLEDKYPKTSAAVKTGAKLIGKGLGIGEAVKLAK